MHIENFFLLLVNIWPEAQGSLKEEFHHDYLLGEAIICLEKSMQTSKEYMKEFKIHNKTTLSIKKNP